MIAVGYEEKCQFCEEIMTKDIKIFDHIFNNHKEKAIEQLFNKEENGNQQNKS